MKISKKLTAPDLRSGALDALRGLAVILMVEQHLGFWLWESPGSLRSRLSAYPLFVGFNGLGGLAAPFFITLSGAGASFLASKHENPDIIFLKRGFGVIILGYILNIVTPSWFSYGSWYVLHLIGFALFITPVIRRLPFPFLLILIVCIIILTVLTQNWLQTPHFLGNRRMRNTGMPGGIFRLALAEGQFPVLPWLAFYISGFAAGRKIQAGHYSYLLKAGSLIIFSAGLLSCAGLSGFRFASLPGCVRIFRFTPNFYPAFVPVTLLLIALPLFFMWIFLFIDRKNYFSGDNPLVCTGRVSLSVLFIHVVLVREASVRLGFWKTFSAWETFIVEAAVISVFVIGAVKWRHSGYRYGAEWLLRKL